MEPGTAGAQKDLASIAYATWGHAAFVFMIMILAGVLGAHCRKIWEKDDDERARERVIYPGVAAAMVVPLFLSVGGSSAFTKALSSDSDFVVNLFLVAGFCVLAGVSAPTFVGALAQKALNVAKEAEAKAERAENLSEAVSEPGENAGEQVRVVAPQIVEKHTNEIADSAQRAVFSALVSSDYTWRTIGGLAKATNLDRSAVRIALAALRSKNLVADKVSSRSGSPMYQARV